VSKFGGVFLLVLIGAAVNAVALRGPNRAAEAYPPRVAANERLTALNGALLFMLLLALAVTVLFIRPLLTAHYAVGIALIPPLALKLCSTGLKFVRYYGHDPEFRLTGPPPLVLRFIDAPLLVGSAAVVMVSGLDLWAFGARFGTWWLSLHTASAVVFMAAVFVHLLSHLRRSATVVAEDASKLPPERALYRRSIVLGCAILAIVLGLAALTYASPFGSSGGAA
jgi:hypothetical protein